MVSGGSVVTEDKVGRQGAPPVAVVSSSSSGTVTTSVDVRVVGSREGVSVMVSVMMTVEATPSMVVVLVVVIVDATWSSMVVSTAVSILVAATLGTPRSISNSPEYAITWHQLTTNTLTNVAWNATATAEFW